MEDIEKLLENAETVRDRAYLLVMYKIADRLHDVDSKLSEHRKEFIDHRDATLKRHTLFDTKFDSHVQDEQRLLNRGLGAWMAITGLLLLVLGFGGWYIVRHILDVDARQELIIERNSNRLTAIETMVQQLLRANEK